jgi:hypothetical protein
MTEYVDDGRPLRLCICLVVLEPNCECHYQDNADLLGKGNGQRGW